MLSCVSSCALTGLTGQRVTVEVDVHPGLPTVTIVGLPGAAVREAKDRLMAALRNSGYKFPQARITVNLAPANLPKAGPAYDLPIALGILKATGQLKVDTDRLLITGEMALDGALRSTPGILPIAAFARQAGYACVVVPEANGPEAALVPGIDVTAAPHLKALVAHLEGRSSLPPPVSRRAAIGAGHIGGGDLTEVRGQGQARRMLEVAAAGGQNLLMTCPLGAGKTLLARCLPSILPPMAFEEALEVTAVYSVAGLLGDSAPLVAERPFRSPHHTVSTAGLAGGSSLLRPGEISLAHNGVLFLDELPEFGRHVLEVLRGPLEDRRVTIARAAGSVTYPARFTLVGARNPCPCGHLDDPMRRCTCSPADIERYGRRVSGPLLDRFDLHAYVPRVSYDDLVGERNGEGSQAVAARVVAARRIQVQRISGRVSELPHQSAASMPIFEDGPVEPRCNADMGPRHITKHCRLDEAARRALRLGMRRAGLSARGYHRAIKVARTIADLDGSPQISVEHIVEALQYARPAGEPTAA